jgi:hypothetical protein
MFERHSKVFKQLGFSVDLSNPKFQKAALSPEISALIAENSTTIKTKLIRIAPFAQYGAKVYPLDLMQQVVAQLAQNTNNKIVPLVEEK